MTRQGFAGAHAIAAAALCGAVLAAQRDIKPAADVSISGELRQWHKVTLTLSGPQAEERVDRTEPVHGLSHDGDLCARVRHADIPCARLFCRRRRRGQFIRDGGQQVAGASGAGQDRTVDLSHRIRRRAKASRWPRRRQGRAVAPFDGRSGTFQVAATDKKSPDFRARGRLQYTGKHYLQFAGSGDYFLKLGADSPETLLAYADFDGTVARKPQVPLHTFTPHVQDWRTGDPTWKGDKGKGLIGALNYLAAKGVNAISFLPYNAGGDGDNVWPFVSRDDKFHYDVSKLDQWQIVFDHAQQKGIYLHFKLQENEIDDNVRGNPSEPARGRPRTGRTGRSGVARWRRPRAGAQAVRARAHRTIRLPAGAELEYRRREHAVERAAARDGDESQRTRIRTAVITSSSTRFRTDRRRCIRRCLASSRPLPARRCRWRGTRCTNGRCDGSSPLSQAKKPWVVANDEQGPASLGVPPDPGYAGFAGKDVKGRRRRLHASRHPQALVMGQSDGGRRGRRVLLRLWACRITTSWRRISAAATRAGITGASLSTFSIPRRSRSGR